ncbi:hypothetical protein GW835_01340 [archaeon]|nr:hypothetical protein [archaeon]NCP79195.1 hypothetical protein [archaeon]NCP97858.1 hypothetical protein [archaeon]NCQ06962.1 hypothetical protein [archaeon]NCQ50758.1 hypothetical protein [archaeon]
MNPSDTLCDISYTFTTPGIYEILVIANDDEGTFSDDLFVEIFDDFSSTILNPTEESNYNVTKTINFNSSYSNNVGNVTCNWSHKRADLPSFTSFSTDCNTSYSFSVFNDYSIKLDTLDDFDSSSDSQTIGINILDLLSSSITMSRTTWNNNETISFTGNYDNNVSTVSCEWILNSNDTNTAVGTNCASLSQTLSSTGSYTIYYKVTDSGTGDISTSSEDFTVVLPLTATIYTPDASDVYNLSEGIIFDVGVSNAIGTKSYQWQYNRNSTGWTNFGSNSYTTTNGFATGGTYEFRVLVTDASRPSPINQVYSDTVSNILISDPLAVSVTSPTTGTNYDTGQTISFNSSVSNAVSGVSNYSWEYSTNQSTWIVFGTSVSNPTYSFSTTGTKYIRVTVTDGASRTATSSSINLVLSAPAVVLLNQTSITSLSGWSQSGGTVVAQPAFSGGGVKLNEFWSSAGFFYQGLSTQGNLVLEGVVSLASENDTSQAGLTFNYSSTSASYVCSITNDYGNDGLYLKYGGSQLATDKDGSWKVPAGNYNIKVEAFGSSKKCKYWEVGDSEPGWTLSVTNSSRNTGQWGGWVLVSGVVKSIKATTYG